MSGWGCQHYIDGECRLLKSECVPGKKGCVLNGRFTFSEPPAPPSDEPPKEDKNSKKQVKK